MYMELVQNVVRVCQVNGLKGKPQNAFGELEEPKKWKSKCMQKEKERKKDEIRGKGDEVEELNYVL